MSDLDSLPDELGYLRESMEAFGKIAPEDLNEDVDIAILEAAIRERIHDLDDDEGQALIDSHREILRTWLESSENKSGAGWFVYGAMSLPGIVEEMRRELTAEERTYWQAEMSLPEEFAGRVEGAEFRAELDGVTLCVKGVDDFVASIALNGIENWQPLPGMQGEASEVRFGDVHGTKFVIRETEPIVSKSVQYVVVGPGGLAMADLFSLVDDVVDFDEARFEEHFHTIRVREVRG